MTDPLLIVARFVQYAAAAILFGLPAFRLYGLRGPARATERVLLIAAAAALAGGALLAIAGQAAAMTGDRAAARDPATWWDVATATQVGQAIGLRVAAGLVALAVLLAQRAAEIPWRAPALLGGLATASFAWSGHGAAGEGVMGGVQLAADVAHLLAASLWLGALAGLGVALSAARRRDPDRQSLSEALEGFAGVGSVLVAVIVVTGLVNSWVLVTPAGLPRLLQSAYGLLLVMKLVLFAAMLACAALNRFRITPALRDTRADELNPLTSLRWSLIVEAACGVGVLALVAALGTLPPPTP